MLVSIATLALFGFIVGTAASLFVGDSGFWEAAAVGTLGALTGGLVARALGWMSTRWSVAGFLLALAGALLLVTVSRAMRRTV